jgi:hypothetical protein
VAAFAATAPGAKETLRQNLQRMTALVPSKSNGAPQAGQFTVLASSSDMGSPSSNGLWGQT